MQSPDNPNCQRLTLPSNPTYWADMRDRPKYGAKLKAQAAMMRVSNVDAARLNGRRREQAVIDQASGRAILTEFETDAYFTALIANLVVAWHVCGEDGRPLPLTPEGVEELETEDGEFLQAQAQKRLNGRPRAEQEDFTMPSSGSSPLGAATPTTETLPIS